MRRLRTVLVHASTMVATAASTIGAVTDTDATYYTGVSLGTEGCPAIFWKKNVSAWPATGYSVAQPVGSVFAASAYPKLAGATLLQALGFNAGKGTDGAAAALLKSGTAALLNASHPDVAFARTPRNVISSVDRALASGRRQVMLDLSRELDLLDNGSCPL